MEQPDNIHENLIFLISSPRAGSTLLQRMLGSHSDIFTHPEPHLVTPLAYLGYYDTVQKAPFDHINAAQAMREFIEELPNGEGDYLDAMRAYASTIYSRVLKANGGTFFLDKTPAYGLVLPFLSKLYPRAKYVVLTRHPLAIAHSVAHSFFDGDYKMAEKINPIVSRYVPAMATFMREQHVPMVHVRYEDLVQDPETHMRRILSFLGLTFEPGTVEYGQHRHITKSYGDPMAVEKYQRPMTHSIAKWAKDMLARPEVLAQARKTIETLDEHDLDIWGYPRATLFDALDLATPQKTEVPSFSTYRIKRNVLLRLRRNIHGRMLGRAVKKIRYYCDVLLRDTGPSTDSKTPVP